MIKVIIKLLIVLLILVGVVLVYDARVLVDRWFGFGNQNEATSGVKILGFLVAIIGGLILLVL